MLLQVCNRFFKNLGFVFGMAEHSVAMKAQHAAHTLRLVAMIEMKRYSNVVTFRHIAFGNTANLATVASAFAKRVVLGRGYSVLVLTSCVSPLATKFFRVLLKLFGSKGFGPSALFNAIRHRIFGKFLRTPLALLCIHVFAIRDRIFSTFFNMPTFSALRFCGTLSFQIRGVFSDLLRTPRFRVRAGLSAAVRS